MSVHLNVHACQASREHLVAQLLVPCLALHKIHEAGLLSLVSTRQTNVEVVQAPALSFQVPQAYR